MKQRIVKHGSAAWLAAIGILLVLTGALGMHAAQRQAAPPRLSPKAGAVIDLTGYWVSIVDEDWTWRETTPAKGDYGSVPLNAEGMRVADAWDPDKDKAEGNECRAYGAANIMRIPERLHITWADENTLQVETDAGMQKRLFHFDGSKWNGGEPQLQGDSVANWDKQIQRRSNGTPFDGPEPGKGGNLHVVTTHMRPGYLQKNGVPYSGNAVLSEHFRILDLDGKPTYMVVTSMVTDPTYLRDTYVLSGQFKREPDGSKWDPEPCRPLWPLQLRSILGRSRRGSVAISQ
jgi:hypothetical protein